MPETLSFKPPTPSNISETQPTHNAPLKQILQSLLVKHSISYDFIQEPVRDFIRATLSDEIQLDKVFRNMDHFVQANLLPSMTLAQKASRTVFCSNIDPANATAYTYEEMKQSLLQQGWDITNIYMTKTKRSIKLQMAQQSLVQKFISHPYTYIGNFRITAKEPEIDPTITLCWDCGQLDYTSQNCTLQKLCIKCGDSSHSFYACSIPAPRDGIQLSEAQKLARYCVTCGTNSDHTTLDYRLCPQKRDILRQRVRTARQKRLEEKDQEVRNTKLIKQTLNLAVREEWPALFTESSQHSQIAAIIILALLEEAATPGTFNNNLNKGFTDNNIPPINYKLNDSTAQHFLQP